MSYVYAVCDVAVWLWNCLFKPTTLGWIFFQNPIEQYEITSLELPLFNTLGLTNLAVVLMLNLAVITIWAATFRGYLASRYDLALQAAYQLIKGVVKENLTIRRQQYFAPLFYLFLVILSANLAGMVPYVFTVTSSFIFTLHLSLAHFIGINQIAAFMHAWGTANLFMPSGTPLIIAPFLILIELVSYLARIFSLSIRLFANMMSGHALLKILSGFAWDLLTSWRARLVLFLLPWAIVTAVMFLELLIAFLQAYVFVVLVTLYIADILISH